MSAGTVGGLRVSARGQHLRVFRPIPLGVYTYVSVRLRDGVETGDITMSGIGALPVSRPQHRP